MARNRIIYQSQAVRINGTTVNGVQSASYGLDLAREDVTQYGQLGAVDRVILEAPTSNMECSFYVSGLSLANTQTLLSGSITGGQFPLLIALSAEGADYSTGSERSVSIKSGYLTSYSAEASVGAIPTNSMSFEGLDITYGASSVTPPVALTSFPLQQDVSLTLGTDYAQFTTHAQSASFSYELGVEPLQQLGGALAYARVPSYPANATITVDGLAVSGDLAAAIADINVIQQRGSTATDVGFAEIANLKISIANYNYELLNATLDSVAFDSSIGDNATCSATFSCSIGGSASHSNFRLV
jgi:hypothetical protein